MRMTLSWSRRRGAGVIKLPELRSQDRRVECQDMLARAGYLRRIGGSFVVPAMRTLDAIDRQIVHLLQQDGRLPNAKLAAAVKLSPSSCLRRLRLLERDGVIRGYTALVEADEPERATVLVEIVLERQTAESMTRFENAVRRCPEVRECYLMSGPSDYLLRVEARDTAEYERIHSEQLSRLPGVSRVKSSFAIRRVKRRS
jgi:DNA-binding Lrp family transcriptional regulator